MFRARREIARSLGDVALALLVAVLFLLQPLPAQNRRWCPEVVHVAPHVGYLLNSDSPAFLALAENPSLLLADDRELTGRQSRPLYVLATWALARPLRAAPGLRALHPHPAYPGCIALNLVVLVLSLAVFERLVARTSSTWPFAAAAGLLLFANDSVKVFVWTPHQQVMTILEPLACVWLTQHVSGRSALSPARAAAYGLATGALVLLYGSFLLLYPALLIGILLRWRKGSDRSTSRSTTAAVVAAITFGLPTAVWIAWVRHVCGEFHSAEIAQYRQFVWMADAWQRGGMSRVGQRLAGYTSEYLRTFTHELIVPTFTLAGVVAIVLAARGRACDVVRERKTTLVACVTSFGLNLAFYWLLGLYAPRFTIAVLPPVLAAIAVVVAGVLEKTSVATRAMITAFTASAVVLALVWVTLKQGPWC